MKKFLFSLLLLTVVSCGFASDKSREAQLDDVREAVFRAMIAHGSNGVSFLGLGMKSTDPSEEFMHRFADHQPPVRKNSDYRTTPDSGIVVDKESGRTGTVYNANNIIWRSDNDVEAAFSFYSSRSHHGTIICTAKKEDGKWKVVKMGLVKFLHARDAADDKTPARK